MNKTFKPIEIHEELWKNCVYNEAEKGFDLSKVPQTYFEECRFTVSTLKNVEI